MGSKVSGPQESRSRAGAGLCSRFGYVMARPMGMRISGTPSCASTAPSTNSTSECTTDCRWMTAVTFSSGSSYSRMASMISSPLFMSVAQSMVIFAPIFQLGWRRASALVTDASSSRLFPKNGPPEQVRISRLTSRWSRQPIRHWKMAECSESTGMISAPDARAAACMSCPAQTMVSLLARAMRLFSWMAVSVGRRAAKPHTAATTVSACGSAAASHSASLPASTLIFISARRVFNSSAAAFSVMTASSGRYLRHWASSRSTFFSAVSAATRRPSSSATDRVWRPMEPVEPRIVIVCVIASPVQTASRTPRAQ